MKWIAEKTFARLLASSTTPAAIPMLLQNNGAFTTNRLSAGSCGTPASTATGGAVVTVMDRGLNTKMVHFSQDTADDGTIGAAHRKVVGYDVCSGDQCSSSFFTADGGHGAMTASTRSARSRT